MQLQTLFGSAASLVGAGGVIAWRLHETRRSVTPPRIVLPPLGMSTGMAMFLSPAMRVPWSWAAAAFVIGAGVLAIPLNYTSKLHREGDSIVMRRSPAFLAILLILVAVRFALRSYIDQLISPLQTAALFFLLAFGMILSWRIRMLLEYRRLAAGAHGHR